MELAVLRYYGFTLSIRLACMGSPSAASQLVAALARCRSRSVRRVLSPCCVSIMSGPRFWCMVSMVDAAEEGGTVFVD